MKKNWWIAGVAVLVAVLVIGVCVASCSTPEEPATSSTGPQGATVTGDEPGETSATESSADASAGSTGTSMTADGGETSGADGVTSDGGPTKEPTKAPTQVTTSKTKATTKTTKAPTKSTGPEGTSTHGASTQGTAKTTNPNFSNPDWADYVRPADPATGLSWDGKSPIVYTYKDGTTGTTPQDGAKYEMMPGIYAYYHAPNNSGTTVPYSGLCSHCGKKSGDGSNGTCLYHLVLDTCPLCGETGIKRQCHTCE